MPGRRSKRSRGRSSSDDPIKIKKWFDQGWFEGEVKSQREDDDGNGILYTVVYEDGDSEELNEKELEVFRKNYEDDKKRHNNTIKIQKCFDVGWFEGEVTNQREDEDGNILYTVRYEDGDQEEVDEKNLNIFVQNYIDDKKNQAIDEYLDDENEDDEDDDDDDPNPPKKRQRRKQQQKPNNKTKNSKGKGKSKENGKKEKSNSKKVQGKPYFSYNSSLWETLDLIDGREVSRDFIVEQIQKNPPPPNSYLQGLEHRIPEMVEFFVLMRERQIMYNNENSETDNEVLQQFHFCNNYRELDRGTTYLRSEVLRLLEDEEKLIKKGGKGMNLHKKLEYTTQVLAMAYYYRQCNLIESFTNPANPAGGIPRLGDFNARFIKYVRSYDPKSDITNPETSNKPFFTTAHLNQGFEKYIDGCSRATKSKLIQKVAKQIVNLQNQPHKENGIHDYHLKHVCQALKQLPGVGPFLAWQIACDLEELCCFGPKLIEVEVEEAGTTTGPGEEGAIEATATTTKEEIVVKYLDEYVELGPGAQKGLRKIFGDQVFDGVKAAHRIGFAELLRDNMKYFLGLVIQQLPQTEEGAGDSGEELLSPMNDDYLFPYWKNNRTVSLKVIEHVLCEYQKFVEIDSGSITGQRRFRSRTSMDERDDVCCEDGDTIRCDTCHKIACDSCQSDLFHCIRGRDGGQWDCCRQCHDLDKLVLFD